MKKVYSKPDVAFDDFSLSVSVANCEIHVVGANSGECAYEYDPGVFIFTSEIQGCWSVNGGIPVEDSVTNGFCYHVPIESNNLFNS